MVSLYRDPDGNNVLGSSSHTYSESSGSTANKLSTRDKKSKSFNDDSVIMLRARIKELEDQLETNEIPAKVGVSLLYIM